MVSRFPKSEVKRKLFHMLVLIYAVAFWYLPKMTVLIALAVGIIITIVVELIRVLSNKFNNLIIKVLGGFFRESEKHKVTAVLWTLIGAFITIVIFDNRLCVLVSFLYLVFGDALAALSGKAFGKHKFFHESKSFEGSFTCFLACLIIGLIAFHSWQLAFAGAFVATLTEILPWPLSDNLWMQVISAGALTFLADVLPV